MTPVPLYMDCRRGGKNRGKTVEKRCPVAPFLQPVRLNLGIVGSLLKLIFRMELYFIFLILKFSITNR